MSATSARPPQASSVGQRRRGAQAREVGGRVDGVVEESADGPALSERRLPEGEAEDAVGALGAEAVVLHRHRYGVEARLSAQQVERVAQGAGVEIAASDRRHRVHGHARRELGRGRVPDDARPEGAHLVEVVGEAEGRLLGGHERLAGGEVTLHRRAAGPAAHRRAAEDHGLAAARRLRDLRAHHLGAGGDDQLDRVLNGLAGEREQDVGGAGAHVDGEDAGAAATAERGRTAGAIAASGLGGASGAARHAGRRAGTPLKRSFQTFFIASRTMSLLILLSPTLRSTKMIGSSTTLKPILYTR